MGKRRRTNFGQSAFDNMATYEQYVDRLTELSVSMFEWKNVPEEIDTRFLELTLFSRGSCVFFKDEVLGYLVLPYTNKGTLDVYKIPVNRRAFAVTGYQKDLNKGDSVIIWNNMLHKNSELDVRMFAQRLYNLDRIIDVNANAQKTPVLVQGSEQQRLTLLNLYKEFDGNAPVIFGDKNLDYNALKVLQTEAPYMCDKLYQLKTQYWNEALTYLGISNLNIQKKERLVSDEAVRAMGGVIASRYSRLESRRTACEAINKMFGLEIDVDFRSDYREADDETMISHETEDEYDTNMVVDLRTQ